MGRGLSRVDLALSCELDRGQRDRDQDEPAAERVLQEGGDVQQGQQVGDDGEDHRADDRTEHRAAPTGESGAADHHSRDRLQLEQVAGGGRAAGEAGEEQPAAQTDEQSAKDVDRPQGRLHGDTRAAGGFDVGPDGVDPTSPDRAIQEEGDERRHREPDECQYRNAEKRGLTEARVGVRRLRVDRDAIAVGVDQAACQSEHAEGDDERLQTAKGHQPAVHGADEAPDGERHDEAEQHRRAAEESGRDDRGEAQRGADADVNTPGQYDDQLGQHHYADDRHLQQQVSQVRAAPEDRPPTEGGDYQQGQQDVEGVLALEPGADLVASGRVLLVMMDGRKRRCRCH